MFTQTKLRTGLIVAVAVETLCATYCLKIPQFSALYSIVHFSAGVCIAILILFFPPACLPRLKYAKFHTGRTYIKILIAGIMGFATYHLSRYWMDSIPLDIDYADMLPVIRVMDQRLLEGHWRQVYDNIPEIWGGTNPIYLPAMWLPFTLSILLHFDMRWIAVGGLFFAFVSFLFLLEPIKNKILFLLVLLIGLILYSWLHTEEVHNFISMTEEGVVVAYYVLLVLALSSNNIYFIAVAASLCLLSRYALIGWIPAFICYLFLNKNRKQALIFTGTGVACLLFLFIVPFGWEPFSRLLKFPGHYVDYARLVWEKSPEFFYESLGFAKFFGPGNVAFLHTILILISFLVPFLFMIFCFYKSKKQSISNIPLAVLKISVVVFYGFIDVPYLYLFYTSSFISLIILSLLIVEDRPAQAQKPI
ncbi:MAG TPA: hypothetical protein VGZ71_12555 [Puia sp.]|nr:hypothetical protein [Puia sp.]